MSESPKLSIDLAQIAANHDWHSRETDWYRGFQSGLGSALDARGNRLGFTVSGSPIWLPLVEFGGG